MEIRKSETKKIKTVGIVGSLCRIGTTTQAVQITKYLKLMGYQAAYVEMNRNEYIKLLCSLYQDAKSEKDFSSYGDVALYEKNQITAAYKKDYDYLIKDYGSISDPEFNSVSVSFLEQDIKIIVCGVKPNEIRQIERVLSNPLFGDVGYIFNFVAKEDRADVIALMEDKGSRTYFADYVPDPYVYLSNANMMCKELLGL